MVGVLGPRVGGAHVDVNLQFDEKSIGAVGRRIHQQLVAIGQRNKAAYQSIGRNAVTAWRGALGAIVSSAPLFGSAVSAIAGSFTALFSAIQNSARSAGGLVGILTSIGVAAFTFKLGMRNFAAAVGETNPKALKELLEGMPKSMQDAVMATRELSNEIRGILWKKMYEGLAPLITQLTETGAIQRGLGKMADSLNGLFTGVLKYVNTAEGIKQINTFFDGTADIFARLSKAAVPFLAGFLNFHNALIPASGRLADRIAEVGRNFQEWTSAPGFAKRIDDAMKSAEHSAGLLINVLTNVWKALGNVFGASLPAGDGFLETLVNITQQFEDWTATVEGQDTIAKWASDSVDVMRTVGETIRSIFKVMAELSDAGVIQSFLTTLGGAFDNIAKLPLDTLVESFVKISTALQPISSVFLAFIIAGAAFNIIIGSIMGQLGGLVSVFSGLFKVLKKAGGGIFTAISALFKPLASAGKHGKELNGLAAAFGRIAGIVGRFAKFIPFVGWAVTFGVIIAKSKELQDKFKELWGAVGGVFDSLKGALQEIWTSLQPLGPGLKKVGAGLENTWNFLQPVVNLLETLVSLAIESFINGLIHIFQGLGKIIEGVGSIISGLIDLLVGIFTLDGSKILDAFGKIFGGLGDVVLGALEGILSPVLGFFDTLGGDIIDGLMGGLFGIADRIHEFGTWIIDGVKSVLGIGSPSTVFAEIGGWLVMGLINGVKAGIPALIGAFLNMVTAVIRVVVSLPVRLAALGLKAITGLTRAFLSGSSKIVSTANRIFLGVVSWIAKLPVRLVQLGLSAITRLAGAVRTGIGILGPIAGSIFKVVVDWFLKLPARLFELGTQAITRLASAARTGVPKLGEIAGNIFNAILEKLLGLPGELFNIGVNMIQSLANGISSALGAVTNAVSSIVGALNPLDDGPKVPFLNDMVNPKTTSTVNPRTSSVIPDAMGGFHPITPRRGVRDSGSSRGTGPATPALTAPSQVTIAQNYYGPTTGRERMRELEWTLRYATKAREATS